MATAETGVGGASGRRGAVTAKRCRQCRQPAHVDRDYFCIPNRRRVLGEVKELTAEDWEVIWIAYQGFRAQVNLIVQRARERAEDAS